VKRLVKKTLGFVGARLGPSLWRWRAPSLLVIMYHRVLPQGHPERVNEQAGMYDSPGSLAMHIEVLARHFEIVHLGDWLRGVSSGQTLPKLACALTFDDGWRDNFEFAYPVLQKAQVPSTIYLVSDLVGTRYSFWPNTLSRLLATPGGRIPAELGRLLPRLATAGESFSAAEIDRVINLCKARYTDAHISELLREFESRAVASPRRDLMDWSEIETMHRSGLVHFGSHTRRHSRLSVVDDPRTLEDEIVGSKREIAERLGAEVTTFCYPNGDTSPAAVELVRKHYAGAVTTRRGWNSVSSERSLLMRVGVHEDIASTADQLLARLSGVI
jgi:peptidoglycan/xylan/chitin deacetylase (PgdA/CDA1 family)